MTTMAADVHRLFVAWQDPKSRRFHAVAQLDRTSTGDYRFVYLKNAETLEGFDPFVSFPNLHRTYISDRLFPLFENRLMSPRRPDYPQFVEDLGLPEDADPFDLLGRSGRRATDSIEVFAEPHMNDDTGHLSTWFFVRGIRHVLEDDAVLQQLRNGDELQLVPDPDNVANGQALLVLEGTSHRIGYVPDYLVDTIHRLRDSGAAVRVMAERVNPPDTPWRARVLCRLEADAPTGFRAFDDPQFLPVLDTSD